MKHQQQGCKIMPVIRGIAEPGLPGHGQLLTDGANGSNKQGHR
jgi:hypothetical protein